LPAPNDEGDKEDRGRVLIVAGSKELPGAAILAGTAALRSGAGKLAIASGESVAGWIAQALPEARVIALPETPDGGFGLDGIHLLSTLANSADATLIGPGMRDGACAAAFARALWPLLGDRPLVLDAAAMEAVIESTGARSVPLLTPHAGELAHLTGQAKKGIVEDPADAALAAARRFNAIVALKGATTHIATPQGELLRHEGGNAGLGTSGSGDVLAGLLVGLAARGASLVQAAAWGVALHARAGEILGRRIGAVGYLARELPAEFPALMTFLAAPRQRSA
jgi:hydroxyethylthiazole kinase-like uncharacterized protein yjeF